MKNKPDVIVKGDSGVMNIPDVGVFSFYTGAGTTDDMWSTLVLSDNGVQWEAYPDLIGGKKIVPYGSNNNLPVVIRNMME